MGRNQNKQIEHATQDNVGTRPLNAWLLEQDVRKCLNGNNKNWTLKNMKNKKVDSGKYRGRIDIFIIGWICVTMHGEEITLV